MIPPMPTGVPVGVADQAVLAGVAEPGARSARGCAPRRRAWSPVSPGAGPAHQQAAAGQPVEVVGVGGLAELQHHVVGGVHHVVDGAHAGGHAAGGPATPATRPPAPRSAPGPVNRGHSSRSSTTTVASDPDRRPRPPGRGAGAPGPTRRHQVGGRRAPRTAGPSGRPGPGPRRPCTRRRAGWPRRPRRTPRRARCRAPRPAATPGRGARRRRSGPGSRRGPRTAAARGPSTASRWTPCPSSSAGRWRSRRAARRPPGPAAPGRPTAKFVAPHATSTGSGAVGHHHPADLVGALDGGDLLDPGDHDVAQALTHAPRPPRPPGRGRPGSRRRRAGVTGEGCEVSEPGKGNAQLLSSRGVAPQNWRRKRMSFSMRARMSAIWWRICAHRSMPKPKANPVHSSASMPTEANTAGSTMPHPPSSIHPVCEHVRHPVAAADGAGHLELGRRLGEGEVGRPQPRVDVGAEVGGGERLDGAGQVGEGDPPVDDQALDLVEDGEVAGVGGVAPVAAARHDRVDRQRAVERRPAPSGGSAPARCGCAAASSRARPGRGRRCPTCPGPDGPGGC